MPKPGEVRYCPELGGKATNAAFVWIPPGSFWMGSKLGEEDNPVHFVVISKGYWMQQTPLTERQYSDKNSDLPQVNISSSDLLKFCQGKPLRRPTEAEWEYAARSNTGHKYLFSGSNTADTVAWTNHNSGSMSHKVGQLKSNSRGLFDMSGNVWEICRDWYNTISTIPQIDPAGPKAGFRLINRGGSPFFPHKGLRISFRRSSVFSESDSQLGARLIWEPQHD